MLNLGLMKAEQQLGNSFKISFSYLLRMLVMDGGRGRLLMDRLDSFRSHTVSCSKVTRLERFTTSKKEKLSHIRHKKNPPVSSTESLIGMTTLNGTIRNKLPLHLTSVSTGTEQEMGSGISEISH